MLFVHLSNLSLSSKNLWFMERNCSAVTAVVSNTIRCLCMHAKSLQSCPTLCDPMDRSPPRSSVHEILQARVLEWVAKSSSRGSSQPRDLSCISYVSWMSRQGSLPRAPPGRFCLAIIAVGNPVALPFEREDILLSEFPNTIEVSNLYHYTNTKTKVL